MFFIYNNNRVISYFPFLVENTKWKTLLIHKSILFFLLQWAFVEILIWVINLRCASHNNICHVATHNLPIVARALPSMS